MTSCLRAGRVRPRAVETLLHRPLAARGWRPPPRPPAPRPCSGDLEHQQRDPLPKLRPGLHALE